VTTLPTSEEKWLLPPKFRLDTPERLAAADAAQAELAKKINSPFVQATPEERERGRAARLVAEHKATAEVLASLIKTYGAQSRPQKRRQRELSAARAALPVVLSQLAEAHAAVGHFRLAAECEPDRKLKAYYLRVWRAIWRDDGHWCACPKTTAGHTQAFVKQDIYSIRHERVMPLMKCAGCNCLNVAPLKPELAEQRAHRRAAVALTRGLAPEDAKKVLTQRGHTAKELLK
jgi:hypothetical protein